MIYSIIINPQPLFVRMKKCKECGNIFKNIDMIKIYNSYWGIDEVDWYCKECGKKYVEMYLKEE